MGTVHGRLSQDLVPRVLHDAAREFVRKLRVPEPVAVRSVLVDRPTQDAFPGHGELRTAVDPNALGDRCPREELRKSCCVNRFGLGALVRFWVVPLDVGAQVWCDLKRTSK